jgi:ABC-type sugar transport system substrate-binding protein
MQRPHRFLSRPWLLLCLLCLTSLSSLSGWAAPPPKKTLRIALLTPRNDEFWTLFNTICQAAAQDLEIVLEWHPALNDPAKHLRDARAILTRRHNRVDALIMKNYSGTAGPIIELAEKAGVYTLLFEEGFTPEEQKQYGRPREKYPHWLGEMLPDNLEAGYDGGKQLIEIARTQGRPLRMLILAGNVSEGSSQERTRGLQVALNEHPDVRVEDFVAGYWRRDLAYTQVRKALTRYPDINLIWSANDTMPVGAREAVIDHFQAEKKPAPVWISGIGSTPPAAQDVVSGKVDISVGGQFLLGAFGLVLLHDYLHGRDFALESSLMRMRMYAFSAANIGPYARAMQQPKAWEKIDFAQFSKVRNPQRYKYDFGFAPILAQLGSSL